MKLIEKLLIANRGEIAVRIIRSARKLGIRTVAIYAGNEEDSQHVRLADEAFGLGTGELLETYLNTARILHIAALSACDAIHPGYGFLSENPEFATACLEAGLTFVGPNPEAILKMGNKVFARELAEKAGIPVTKGLTGDPSLILEQAATIPFPVLVKAAAGGGGKGMRIVNEPAGLKEALEATSREAATYFGDGTVYLEQYIKQPRHIEVQVLGDKHNKLIHLYERECSIQRRYQKIVEESPSPTLTREVREKMGKAAISFAETIHYDNAGTVEFLVDTDMNFYFLEMNTRIQVEHPVTEMVTGVDLVMEQLLIAGGYPLRLAQDEIHQHGHAIECRIYAEDPENNFLPSPGEISLYIEPQGKDIRIDSSIDSAGLIRNQYDPMISKLIVWGENRDLARQKMLQALDHYIIHGIKNNIPYLKGILEQEDFRNNNISTDFCKNLTPAILEEACQKKKNLPLEIPALACLLFSLNPTTLASNTDIWKKIGYWRLISELKLTFDDWDIPVAILRNYGLHYHFLVKDIEYETSLLKNENGKVEFTANGNHYLAYASATGKGSYQVSFLGTVFSCSRGDFLPESSLYATAHSGIADKVISLMPGKVVRVNVTHGQKVTKGSVLLIVEAMKMENNILAPKDGIIGHFNLKPGDLVEAQTELIQILEMNETG